MKTWKTYNDLINEGGEGYNPFNKPINNKSHFTKKIRFVEPKSEGFFKLNGKGNIIRLSDGVKMIERLELLLKKPLSDNVLDGFKKEIVDIKKSMLTAK
jgi:hypothetical protein